MQLQALQLEGAMRVSRAVRGSRSTGAANHFVCCSAYAKEENKMRTVNMFLAALLTAGLPAIAQQHPQDHGRPAMPPPSRGPAPYHAPKAAPAHKTNDVRQQQVQQRNYSDQKGHPNAPHVDRGNKWVGHDTVWTFASLESCRRRTESLQVRQLVLERCASRFCILRWLELGC